MCIKSKKKKIYKKQSLAINIQTATDLLLISFSKICFVQSLTLQKQFVNLVYACVCVCVCMFIQEVISSSTEKEHRANVS